MDIDTPADLAAARAGWVRPLVLVPRCVEGGGWGHLVRCVTLAQALVGMGAKVEVSDLLVEDPVARRWLGELHPGGGWSEADGMDVVVDAGDVRGRELVELAETVRSRGTERARMGPGALVVIENRNRNGLERADLAFDELARPEHWDGQHAGPRWAITPLLLAATPRPLVDRPGGLLVTFGGSDPGFYTEQTIDHLATLGVTDVTVVLPPGRPLDADVGELPESAGIELVTPGSAGIVPLLWNARVVLCGNGRTVHEAHAAGVPAVAVPQNVLEREHRRSPAAVNHHELDDGVAAAVELFADPVGNGTEHLAAAGRALVDGLGAYRVAWAILGEQIVNA